MDESPPDRCGYTWPNNHVIDDDPASQNCCWRKTTEDASHCIWHADPEKVEKPMEELRKARTPPEIREFTSMKFGSEPLDGVKLSGIDIGDNLNFEEVSLRDANFSEANLQGINLSNTCLIGSDMTNTNLKYSNISESTLIDANLSNAKISGADFSGSNFNNANLRSISVHESGSKSAYKTTWFEKESEKPTANFSGVFLPGTDFSNAEIWGADVSGAFIGGADFSNADLEGADFSDIKTTHTMPGFDPGDANLSGADLLRANLKDAELRKAKFSGANMAQANLSNADLRGKDLTGLNFSEAKLINSCIKETNLTDANFQDANLSDSDLEHAVLIRTNLFDADLTNTKPHGTTFTDVQINDDTEIRSEELRNKKARWWQRGPLFPLQRCGYDPEQNREHWMEFVPGCRLLYQRFTNNSQQDETIQLGKAADTYQTFEKLARENARPSLQSEMFVLRQDMQRKRYWHTGEYLKWAFSRVSRAVFKHGESLGRIMLSAVLIIFSFGAVYSYFDLIIDANGEFISNPVDALYFSTLTFTTLGLGDFQPSPTSEVGRILVTGQAALGAILIAIFVFVLGRRAAK